MNPMDANEQPVSPRARIQELLHLPPLAPVAQELLRELGRDEIDIPRLAQVIEKDPGLTARLIGVANSAYFSQRDPIYDLTTAIIRVLGLNLVKSLSLGIALSAPFDTSGCKAFQLDRYWYVAMLTSTLANQLAPQAKLEPGAGDYLFLAGLLHNLGELVLAHCFKDEVCKVAYESHLQKDRTLAQLQSEIIGLTSAEAGVALGHKWHLPEKVVQVIGHHLNTQYREEDWRTVCLVGYCSRLVDADYCAPGQTPDEEQIAEGNALQLPENAVLAALERLQSKNEQTMALAKALANGDSQGG